MKYWWKDDNGDSIFIGANSVTFGEGSFFRMEFHPPVICDPVDWFILFEEGAGEITTGPGPEQSLPVETDPGAFIRFLQSRDRVEFSDSPGTFWPGEVFESSMKMVKKILHNDSSEEDASTEDGVTHHIETPFGDIEIHVARDGVQIHNSEGDEYVLTHDDVDSDRRMFERLIGFHQASVDMLKRRMENAE